MATDTNIGFKDRNNPISYTQDVAVTKKEQNTPRQNVASQYNRTYEASPQFPINIPALASGAKHVVDLHRDSTQSEKYGVMTNLFIVNNSSQLIYLYPNQSSARAIPIPSGVQIEFDRNALSGGFTSFTIYNAGSGATSANEVLTTSYKQGVSVDKIIGVAHKNFVRFLFGARNG